MFLKQVSKIGEVRGKLCILPASWVCVEGHCLERGMQSPGYCLSAASSACSGWLETGRCKAGDYRPGDLLGKLREMCLKTGTSPRDLLQSRMLWLDDFVVISCLLVHDLRCLITSGPEKHV